MATISGPVAAIDCGTNSIRLLILSAGDPPEELERRLELVRLGQGIDATGEFHPDALRRTFEACDEFAALIESRGCDRIRFIATSAARDARNREEFMSGVKHRFGVDPEIISGDEEAELGFRGALSGVEARGRTLVFDIGGGSTELVTGDADGRIGRAVSLDMGSVRITERFFSHRPPQRSEVLQAREFVNDLLDGSGIDLTSVDTAIGVAGTVTSTAAAVLGLSAYDRSKVHRLRMSSADVERISADWLSCSLEQMIAKPGMHPLRAEVLPAGSLIFTEIARRLRMGCVIVSETDILDGTAHQMLSF